MLARVRPHLLRHWFLGVYVIIAGLWLVTTVAYALGAGGITFGNRYTGDRARIDFQRGHDRQVLALPHRRGLLIHPGTPVHATVVPLRRGLPAPICWACGKDETAGAVVDVEYRRGPWLYHAPLAIADELAALARAGGDPRWQARRAEMLRTVAYNLDTGELRQVAATATVDDQARALAELGLPLDDGARLSSATAGDLRTASIQREGCVIVQLAFVAVALLWLVVGGGAALIVALVRRLRR